MRYLVIVIDAVLVGRVLTRYRSVRNAPTQGSGYRQLPIVDAPASL